MNNLVSIVIPNYNRESLIGGTLDSIIGQTYVNWECLIVDDGSTDNSVAVIHTYLEKDPRFKLFQRPAQYPKGANACRNIGMSKSEGDYIIYFDSDDLMTTDHLEKKLNFVVRADLDYAVFKSKHFGQPSDEDEYIDYSYYQTYEFTADNYLTNKMRFFTNDLIVKSALAKESPFYQKYQSDLENVLMTQLVLKSSKNGFCDEIVTLKRYHPDNITQGLAQSEKKTLIHVFFFYYNILDYLYQLNASETAKSFVQDQLIYFYRKINFKLEVPFFDFLFKIIRLGSPKNIVAITNKRLKKLG
ncbi:glycosyltransferase family 2 protein [Chryseobacterium sp. FH1]|uniref:glycosyltransferase family 2 protein n=1 Tax=Chryseobacterium sp. FH1 TaxID=1233951 RepID=UPI000689CCF3|nr:glycosyltransferase family 2 protein [Chryseobacterium sp. FH1]